LKNTYICPGCKQEFIWDDSQDETVIKCPKCGVEMAAPAPLLPKGSEVGDYLIRERIGVGGMGEVYLAEQKSMKRPVALKILHEDLIRDKAYLERFYREVRILAQIEHPNVVRAIEAGYNGKVYYFSMTFIDGKDIKRLLDEGRQFPEKEAIWIASEIAHALKYAWEKHGILHRDIKPANIMLTNENEVKLMDLGISKKMKGEDVELTMAGMMVGSPQYVSPEQAKGLKDLDFRADMYSLGASLYHILTGSPPYPGENAMEVLAKHLDDPVPDPRNLRPSVSQATVDLIKMMMAKNKDNRFPDWDECIGMMEEIMDELSKPPAAPVGSAAPLKEPVKGQPAPAAAKKAAVSRKGLSPLVKIILYSVLLVIFLSGFIVMLRKGGEDAKRDKARKLYMEAVTFIENNPEPANFRKALVMFENVQKVGEPQYSAEASKAMDRILEKAEKIKARRNLDRQKRALEELKKKSYDFEQNGEYDKAIAFWENYQRNGEYAKAFEFEIRKAVDYLNRKKKSNEEGVE